jgi:pyruvate dehydrogenase E2 component (dihydrolipoamide acetyltransferase)
MERVFALPDLGEGLEGGKIVAWLVAPGDEVALNQPLVEIETAKAVVEVPSPVAGRVVKLHRTEDDDVPVGGPLVTFDVGTETAPGAGSAPGAVKATPPVRRLAKELGVDLSGIAATGAGGRVTEDDVRSAAGGSSDRVALTTVRKTIAASLSAQATIPQVTTFRTLDCSALETFRSELGVSPLPVVIAALCATATEHPIVNAAWGEDHIAMRGEVNVGIAADTERGLLVPVLKGAGRLGIGGIAQRVRALAEAARAGTLEPSDLAGATIAVSNTGSYGSEAGTPILSPGTSVTLALGVIAPRALVVEGQVVARPAATLSLTFDHRVMDGAAAGRALTHLVDLLQSPERLRDLPR